MPINQQNNALILNNIPLSISGYGTNIREDILLEQIVSKGNIIDKGVKKIFRSCRTMSLKFNLFME